jgi:FkbM family methyltransferase
VLLSSSAIHKRINIAKRPSLFRVAVKHRVAAATEHLEAIRLTSANTLIDAGANKGQFSLAFRHTRPDARIIAFEPLPEAADTYDMVFGRDARSGLQRAALGSAERTATFFVADRSDSSSLLRPGDGEERAFGVRAAGTINVPVKRLDSCIDLDSLEHPILLKVDVQGGELELFEGANSLEPVDYIYVELSFVELYEGQPLFQDVVDYLTRRGFTMIGFFNQVSTPEFGPTQVDVLFRSAPPQLPREAR